MIWNSVMQKNDCSNMQMDIITMLLIEREKQQPNLLRK